MKHDLRSARSAFKSVYHSDETNFMTPRVVRYGWAGSRCYELSVGDSIMRDGEKLWGVTLVDSVRKIKLYDESKCFSTEVDAEKYIVELRGRSK